jgi:hypothetical protein
MHLVELKFVVSSSTSQPELDHLLRNTLPATAVEHRQKESDYYYRAVKGDYCLVRYSEHETRLEVSGHANGQPALMITDLPPESLPFVMMRAVCGPEVAVLQRTTTYFGLRSHTEVSTVVAEGYDHVLLHISGDDSREVTELAEHIKDALREAGIALSPEPRSDFAMFIEPLMGLP